MISFSERLLLNARRSIPALTLALLLLISALPDLWQISWMPMVFISWIGTYYWVLFRPQLMPYWLLFLVGLMQDIFSGLPLGTSSCLLLLARWLILRLRHMVSMQYFWAIWLGFAMLTLLLGLLLWLFLGLVDHHFAAATLMQCLQTVLATIVCYPPFHLLFNRLYTLLPTLHRSAYGL